MNRSVGCAPSLPAALDAMLQSLESQCRMADQLVALAQLSPDASDPDLLSFAAQVEQLESMLAAHDAAMDEEEEALQHTEEVLLPELREMNQQLREQQQSVEDSAAMIAAQAQRPATGATRPPLSNRTNLQSASQLDSGKKARQADPSAPAPSVSPSRLRLEPVSAEEFQSIPSYMRGRLDRAKLQSALDTWAALLRTKYSLLETPTAQLSEAQRRQVAVWKCEEGDDTAGCPFLSSEDVRQCADLQSLGSTNLKAVLVGLRHLGRVKNSTTSGTTKYILL